MDSDHFASDCHKCGDPLVIALDDKNDNDYYLCNTCALVKAGY